MQIRRTHACGSCDVSSPNCWAQRRLTRKGMMNQLDSVLSQLRNGYSPDGAARRRVRSALTTSLAVGAVLGTANLKATAAAIGSTAGAKSVSLGKLLFFGKVVVGLGATATAT